MQHHGKVEEPELFPEIEQPEEEHAGRDAELLQANERAERLEHEMTELRALVEKMAAGREKRRSHRHGDHHAREESSVFPAAAGKVKSEAAEALARAVHGDAKEHHASDRHAAADGQSHAKGGVPVRDGSSSGDSVARRQARELVDEGDDATASKQPPSPSTAEGEPGVGGGEAELRRDSMMAHLLDSLEAHEDIGHYGRLVFAMVARHFLPHEEVLGWLLKDEDLGEEEGRQMLLQVEQRDYSPPRRDRILQWQAEQEFPILPNVEDPDCGNLYRNLNFPDAIYKHIGHYREQKADAGE